MKSLRLILGSVALLGSVLVAHAQFTWSGLAGPSDQDVTTAANWQGGTAPLFDGTEDIILGKAINNDLFLSSDTAINSLTLNSGDEYHLDGSGVVLRIGSGPGNGIYGTVGNNSRMVFSQNIDIAANGGGFIQMDAGDSTLAFAGKIIDDPMGGVTNVILSNANGGTMGAFVFNDTCTGSSYTGDTYIQGVPGQPVAVAFWNDHPFGDINGTLFIQNAAQLIAHGSRDVENDIEISTTDTISFKSWDDTVYYDGDITLAANTTLAAQRSTQGLPSSDTSGVYPTPGPMTRYAIDFDYNIDETGGARSLTVNGQGVVVLEGFNSYTGGTVVGSGGANGSLVFSYSGSVPVTGLVTVNGNGYAGFADYTPGEFVNFLHGTAFNFAGSTGSVGIDTLPWDTTETFSDPIDLTGANANLRIGSATSAILTGLITPQSTTYRFGNGGGTLYVQSDLSGIGHSVQMTNSSVVPLTLYLQGGNNTYTGGTVVNNGFVIFDSDGALPSSGTLTATTAGGSYIGYTDQAYISAAYFLGQFNVGATNGIIGFDTNLNTLANTGPAIFTDDIDLSTFNNGVYIGTATGAILTGNLTPTADNILRLTAAQGSTLEVDSPLSGAMALSLGTTDPNDIYSNGTIYLPYANTYTGGTTINSTAGGITLEVGDNNSLGSGALTLPQGVIAGLHGSTYDIALPNNIVFSAGASPAQLFISSNYGIELDGNISGPGSISVMDPDYTSLVLAGNNTFTGDINLYNATLYLNSDTAAGTGSIRFLNDSTLNFSALNPVIYGISGESGSINLNDGMALTFDMSSSVNAHEFGGYMGNESSPDASVTVTSTTGGDALYLYGYSNYSGGTYVGTGPTDHAGLALGSDNAVGSGPVTLNTAGPLSGNPGILALNAGVTLTNDLNYIGGSLQGFGTFAPTSVNSVAGGPIIFDTNKGVVAGIYGVGTKANPGQLTLATGADFANGGAMLWVIQDGSVQGGGLSSGFSTVIVDGGTGGNLNISATSGQFTLFLASVNSNGTPGDPTNLVLGANNMFLIATTTSGASLLNFNAADFTVDTSLFTTPVSSVFLTADANNIWINFTPVPEPSTYALLGLGLGAVLFPALRRRKRVG